MRTNIKKDELIKILQESKHEVLQITFGKIYNIITMPKDTQKAIYKKSFGGD